jgi:hypothetical protein
MSLKVTAISCARRYALADLHIPMTPHTTHHTTTYFFFTGLLAAFFAAALPLAVYGYFLPFTIGI